jgi:hypothetical protein
MKRCFFKGKSIESESARKGTEGDGDYGLRRTGHGANNGTWSVCREDSPLLQQWQQEECFSLQGG